jgi:hypothetical protein
MKESYEKGVANRLGPELCGDGREAGHEAVVAVRPGQVLSPEITPTGLLTPVSLCGRQHPVQRERELDRDPRGRKP